MHLEMFVWSEPARNDVSLGFKAGLGEKVKMSSH